MALVATSAFAAQPATSPATRPSAFEEQLEAIDRRAGEVADLTANFVQEKRSPLLRDPLISRGTVRARGGVALWDVVEPEPSRMSIDPQALRVYYPRQKTLEEYPVRGQLGMMAASPLPRLRAIRQSFRMMPDDGAGLSPAIGERAASVRAVRMEPADAELKQFVDHARVLLDAERGLVLVFEMTDPDGERTLIRFTNLRPNAGLDEGELKLTVPAGTKVVRPLEGAAPPTTR